MPERGAREDVEAEGYSDARPVQVAPADPRKNIQDLSLEECCQDMVCEEPRCLTICPLLS